MLFSNWLQKICSKHFGGRVFLLSDQEFLKYKIHFIYTILLQNNYHFEFIQNLRIQILKK